MGEAGGPFTDIYCSEGTLGWSHTQVPLASLAHFGLWILSIGMALLPKMY